MAMDFRLDFSDVNKEMVITPPSSSLAFQDMYQSLLHTLPESQTAFGRSSMVPTFTQNATVPEQTVESVDDPDHDGLNNMLELFFGTDPHNPDTDGDGVSDGAEVKRGSNPRGKGTLFGFGLGK